MNILVAIPYEPERPSIWPETAGTLAARLSGANPGMVFDLALHAAPRQHNAGDGPFSAHARARNSLLDLFLRSDHDSVLWIDSDIVDYSADLPTQLLEINPGGVSAPAVLLPTRTGAARFYDTMGFVEHGARARVFPPWFRQTGPVVELDCVGCLYLAPAALYRSGARYADVPGHTEHMAVMLHARAAGLRIVCDTRLIAFHAYLPEYGESLH